MRSHFSFTHHGLRVEEVRETSVCEETEQENQEKVRDKQTRSRLRGSKAFSWNTAILVLAKYYYRVDATLEVFVYLHFSFMQLLSIHSCELIVTFKTLVLLRLFRWHFSLTPNAEVNLNKKVHTRNSSNTGSQHHFCYCIINMIYTAFQLIGKCSAREGSLLRKQKAHLPSFKANES